MPYDHCQICGAGGFQTWEAFNYHHEARHNVSPLKSKNRPLEIDITEVRPAYMRMSQVKKAKIVEQAETRIRLEAWDMSRMNPLIGSDTVSSEPVWDKERNIL